MRNFKRKNVAATGTAIETATKASIDAGSYSVPSVSVPLNYVQDNTNGISSAPQTPVNTGSVPVSVAPSCAMTAPSGAPNENSNTAASKKYKYRPVRTEAEMDCFYKAWESINAYCSDKDNKLYPHIGGKGIKVCDRWKKYDGFRDDMFPNYNHQLTLGINVLLLRIDLNGNFGPENCWWGKMGAKLPDMGIYKIWKRMQTVCEDPKDSIWKNFGGKGITVCSRWKVFGFFYQDMGPEYIDSLSLALLSKSLEFSAESCAWASLPNDKKHSPLCFDPIIKVRDLDEYRPATIYPESLVNPVAPAVPVPQPSNEPVIPIIRPADITPITIFVPENPLIAEFRATFGYGTSPTHSDEEFKKTNGAENVTVPHNSPKADLPSSDIAETVSGEIEIPNASPVTPVPAVVPVEEESGIAPEEKSCDPIPHRH